MRFAPEQAHVGSARRLAMDRAFALAPKNSVLLSTDADAVPRYDWVEANLRAIASGADLVGGHIVGDEHEEALLGPRFVRRAMRHLYYAKLVDRLASLVVPLPEDPWPRHSDHTGASLAVRSEVYAAVGGMPALPFREDITFVGSACRAGYRLRHPLDVQVTVSARLDGRAIGGMSDCLKAWMAAEESGAPHLVEDPQAIIVRLRHLNRQRARTVRFVEEGENNAHFSYVGAIEGAKSDSGKSIEVELAINQLEELIADNESKIYVTGSSTMDLYKALSEVQGRMPLHAIERVCFLNACRQARPTTDDIEIFRNRQRRKDLPPLGHLTQAQEIEKTFLETGHWNSRMSATAKKKSAYMALGFGLAALLRGTFAVRFDW